MAEHAQSFPKSARLLRAVEFRHVFQQPLTSKDACFTILFRPRSVSPGRLGLAISRKLAARAVDRNRLKRIVRESFRRHRDLMHYLDCVVLCRSGARVLPNATLLASLEAHWQKLYRRQCESC